MADRREQFKKVGDSANARSNRHDASSLVRKQKKEEQIQNRRRTDTLGTAAQGGEQSMRPVSGLLPVVQTEGLSDRMRERLAKLPQMVEGLYSNDRKVVHECTEQIRKLLSIERKPPIEEVIATGIVPRLVEFIKQEESTELQFEAAWALTNIASGTTHHTRIVIDSGAVPIFTKLLTSPNADVREQAIWALGNIAGDMVSYRNLVLETGAMPLLLQLLSRPDNKISVVRNGTWTLSNFCRGKPSPPLQVVQPALQVIYDLIRMPDEDVIVDACWALSYISDGTSEKIQAIIASGVCPRLVELLMFRSEAVQTPALRAIGNIVTGSDVQTQVVINLGVLQCINQLLGSRKQSIVKEACWTISNITAGLPDQIQAVISANLIQPLIMLLKSADFDVKKEAAWAISNATSGGTPAQIEYFVQCGAIAPFCDLLDERDHNVVVVALDCLENILKTGKRENGENRFAVAIEEAGGIDKIEELTVHAQEEVSAKASQLIDDFFAIDDEQPNWSDNQSGAAPGPAGFQFQFNQ
ncbi:hypothetical protein BASA81_002468 [Batrachochytrium salamandrivorans]|nr:hypothetical protein BASA81_002468 [Batrachochytrium salamandrivorans]